MNTTDTTTKRPLAERITEGPIHQAQRTLTGQHGFPICDLRNDEIPCVEMLANAELIAEAFNVTHETGRTPRQLADERAELIAALADCAESLSRLPDVEGAFRATCYQQAARALANAISPSKA